MRSAFRIVAIGALLIVAGCSRPAAREDLLAALPVAEVLRADGDLLFSERVTRRGWGLEESDGEGPFRWALGGEAEVEFHSLGEPTTLYVRARGATAPGLAAQPVVAALNGVEIAALELSPRWADLELPLTTPALRRGVNRLSLGFAQPLRPGPGDRERRTLAACFRALRLGPPRPLPEGQRPLRLELGSATGALGVGWGEPREGGPEGAGWRWAPAPRAELALDLSTPADRRLRLTARRPDELASQRVELWLNGSQLGTRELGERWSTVSAEAPREEWRPGRNELVLRFQTVAEVGGEPRVAGVARVAVETLGEPALEQDFDERGRLVVQPAGTSIDLFRRLPEGEVRLELEAGFRPGSLSRVALDVEPDGGGPAEAWRGKLVDGEPREVDLSRWAGSLARLRLSAPGSDVVWRRLELVGGPAPRPPLEPPPLEAPPVPPPAERPNLLLYVVDALRADRTSLYGYHRRTTPRLDELAATSVLYDPAWANSSWTRPAVASLLTGVLPSAHGVTNTLSAGPEVELISQTLQRAGYATHALVTNPYLDGPWSLDRGWDEYRYLDTGPGFRDSSAALNREVIPRLDELASAGRPFFLYLHSMDVHAPYEPPEGYREFLDPAYAGPVDGSIPSVLELQRALRRDGIEAHRADVERLGDLYDGGILHNDARIGELIDALEERGLLETTAILVTSDHGEELFEHGGAMHGHALYQEQIAIPMLLRPPGGGEPQRVAGAQQVDVAVLLALLAGVPAPERVGRRLYFEAAAGRRPVFAEVEMADRRVWALVEEGMKLHYNRNPVHAGWLGRPARELFDLRTDPGERVDLHAARPVVAGYLLERARAIAAELPGGDRRNTIEAERLDEETRERLRALGYLE